MFKKRTTIDTGAALMNVEAHIESERTTFTSYINNISIRGFALHVGRAAEAYVDCVAAACQCPTDADDERLTKELTKFIEDNTTHQ